METFPETVLFVICMQKTPPKKHVQRFLIRVNGSYSTYKDGEQDQVPRMLPPKETVEMTQRHAGSLGVIGVSIIFKAVEGALTGGPCSTPTQCR